MPPKRKYDGSGLGGRGYGRQVFFCLAHFAIREMMTCTDQNESEMEPSHVYKIPRLHRTL